MKIKWLETAPFFVCPWRDIRHASRDGGEGRRGADGYPNAKGVPCDVPPVALPPDNNALKNKP
ncbi:hypothetical protein DXB25_06025 [Lachnospiraceae bacterium OM02-31]|nr:hypothetical protein DXB25_06025 [Lachnospiraceae bacterium OM02-31]RJW58617.1 hypothetical protein DXB24_05240 [Lachnospiraceae bacterium OM02-3]